MLLSAQEIALARERALNNMLALSFACIESAHQLSSALAAAGRASVEHGGQHWSQFSLPRPETAVRLPATFWLDNLARAGQLFEEAALIFGETQKAVIRSAEMQVRIFDAMAVAAIERVRKSTPWEGEPALDAMRQSLRSAEQTVHELSEAAVETVERLENDMRDASVSPLGNKAAS